MKMLGIRDCKRCHKVFEVIKAVQVYCSHSCSHAWAHVDKIPLVCFRCDREYTTTRDRARRREQKGEASVCPNCRMSAGARVSGRKRGHEFANKKKVKLEIFDTKKLKKWCHNCQHGRREPSAELGWSCSANATVCKPWAGLTLWEPISATV